MHCMQTALQPCEHQQHCFKFFYTCWAATSVNTHLCLGGSCCSAFHSTAAACGAGGSCGLRERLSAVTQQCSSAIAEARAVKLAAVNCKRQAHQTVQERTIECG
jgi:hypothetical protein